MQRAVRRITLQEVQRQENVENIVKLAADNLPATVSKEPVDPDWVSRFFDDCKDVSNRELQLLWGRLLAGEVATPGSCSRKTLAILKDLSQDDARLFNNFASLVWLITLQPTHCFIPYRKDITITDLLQKYGINYGHCLVLDSLGLIHCKTDVNLPLDYGDELRHSEFNHIVYCEPKNKKIIIPVLPLTDVGGKLFSLLTPQLNWSFYYDSLILFREKFNAILVCKIRE